VVLNGAKELGGRGWESGDQVGDDTRPSRVRCGDQHAWGRSVGAETAAGEVVEVDPELVAQAVNAFGSPVDLDPPAVTVAPRLRICSVNMMSSKLLITARVRRTWCFTRSPRKSWRDTATENNPTFQDTKTGTSLGRKGGSKPGNVWFQLSRSVISS
jgi:hypothetical protein